jgi:hypothetical protein
MFWRRRRERELADARAEAQRWYERLGGQITTLHGESQAVKQALADAGERYTAAGAALDQAQSPRQYELARETALEGLYYVRAARTAMNIDPGPELPALPSQLGVPPIGQARELEVQGHQYRASPAPDDATPYYYPGGRLQGRPVPAGWYSEPWWRSALSTGAGVFGGLLLFDVLAGGFANAAGYDQGFAQGYDQGYDQGMDQGDYGGGEAGGDVGGDFGGGDFGGF